MSKPGYVGHSGDVCMYFCWHFQAVRTWSTVLRSWNQVEISHVHWIWLTLTNTPMQAINWFRPVAQFFFAKRCLVVPNDAKSLAPSRSSCQLTSYVVSTVSFAKISVFGNPQKDRKVHSKNYFSRCLHTMLVVSAVFYLFGGSYNPNVWENEVLRICLSLRCLSAWDFGVPRERGRPPFPAMADSGNNSNMLVKCETKSNRVKGLSFLDLFRYLKITI